MSSITFSPSDALADSAVKYKQTLAVIPHRKFERMKSEMGFHHRGNLYGTEKAGMLIMGGKMGPYNSDDATLASAGIVVEQITTYHGKNYIKIEITDVENTMFGEGVVTMADWKKSELGKKILSEYLQANLESIVDVIWTATRKADGTETTDLFDGFDTLITTAEVKRATEAQARISTGAENLSTLTEAITSVNAKDVLFAQWKTLPDQLKKQKLDLHITEEIYYAYCDAFALDRGDGNNLEYDQEFLFGTKKKVRLVPCVDREIDAPLVWTVKKNLTIATGSRGTREQFLVKPDNNIAFVQLNHEMYFGAAIACYHKHFFHLTKQFAG